MKRTLSIDMGKPPRLSDERERVHVFGMRRTFPLLISV